MRHAFARLAPLVRLLGSDKDGEVNASVRAMQRRLESDGKDLHDFAASLESHVELEPAYEPAEPESWPEWSKQADAPELRESNWGAIARWLQNVGAGVLNARERRFIDDMTCLRGWPTRRQTAWQLALAERMERRAAA
jgi:hypothetical protein